MNYCQPETASLHPCPYAVPSLYNQWSLTGSQCEGFATDQQQMCRALSSLPLTLFPESLCLAGLQPVISGDGGRGAKRSALKGLARTQAVEPRDPFTYPVCLRMDSHRAWLCGTSILSQPGCFSTGLNGKWMLIWSRVCNDTSDTVLVGSVINI